MSKQHTRDWLSTNKSSTANVSTSTESVNGRVNADLTIADSLGGMAKINFSVGSATSLNQAKSKLNKLRKAINTVETALEAYDS